MKLSEHPDFEQAILRAEDHFRDQGLRAEFIEKDYYVTEALRAIGQAAGDVVIFKGGTSLSKGWNLIQRFSEDIDLFLDPQAFDPPLGTNAINRELKKLRDAVTENVQVTFLPEKSSTMGGSGRSDRFAYDQKFGGPGAVAGEILLEAGVASGREPTENVQLQSCLVQFLQETGASLGAEDETSFPMRLLHFRRTFVEKLFAIHKRVEMLRRDGRPVGPHARHYYDLYQLALRPEVQDMLRSDEYNQIKEDYDRISRTYYPDHYFYPEDMRFANSEALYPDAKLSIALGAEYKAQCAALCYASYPEWGDVLEEFRKMRDSL